MKGGIRQVPPSICNMLCINALVAETVCVCGSSEGYIDEPNSSGYTVVTALATASPAAAVVVGAAYRSHRQVANGEFPEIEFLRDVRMNRGGRGRALDGNLDGLLRLRANDSRLFQIAPDQRLNLRLGGARLKACANERHARIL